MTLALHFDADLLDEDGAPVSQYGPGDRLPGGCHAEARLGVGHRCETWLGWSTELCAPVVVKFPRPHQVEHPRARGTLCREVAALGGNLHPALPRLYADGTQAAVPYLVIEHVDGPDLDDELDERGALEPVEAALLGLQLAAALRTVHARGHAHVDLKPANVVLRDARPVLIDFGSARPIGAAQPSGRLIGSPGYAAPDLEAGRPISAAMDGYGLGLTLYEALTGEIAFDPDLPAEARPELAPLPDTPPARLVQRLLDPDPAGRPDLDTAVTEFAAAAAAEGRPVWPQWFRLERDV
jgi:serine/threonine protein kinase